MAKRFSWQFCRPAAAILALLIAGSAAAAGPEISPLDQSRTIQISTAAGTASQRVPLATNQVLVVELDRDVRDVVVANPQIADAIVKAPRRIFLMSLKPGQTNAVFFDAQGKQIANLQIVVGTNVATLNEQIAQRLPGTSAKAEAVNDRIVLSGTVNNVEEASEVQTLAAPFAGDPNKIVDKLTIAEHEQVLIQVRVSEMSRTVSKQLGINAISAIQTSAGVPLIAQTDNQFSLVGSALSSMGIQVGNVFPNTSGIGGNVCPPPLTTTCQNLSPIKQSNNLAGILQALEQVGLVHTLAEPNLTAVSGETAKFLAGGEFPVPVARDLQGNVTIQYKPFGVGLSFTPVVLSKGRISLQISTEVSELTNTGAYTIASSTPNTSGSAGAGTTSSCSAPAGTSCTPAGTTTSCLVPIGATSCSVTTSQPVSTITAPGATLPALSVRRTETTVELPSGGSLAIGGLIQQETKQNLNSLPGVDNLPILGALFRSRDFQNNETELVVTVTAYLVNPVAPAEFVGPDDGYATPTDLETILLGRLNAVYGKDGKAPPNLSKDSLGYIVP